MKTNLSPLKTLAVLAVLNSAPLLHAESVVLEPVQDNSIFEEGDLSNGAGIHLFAGKTAGSAGFAYRRALLKFDPAASIPAGSTIKSATLRLNVSKQPFGATENPFSIHKLTTGWGEGSSDAGDTRDGVGATATTGDATWNHAFYSSITWTPGGAFSVAASSTASVSGLGGHTWSGAGLAIDVQAWLDEPDNNSGWILIGPDIDKSARRFDSREHTVAANRPKLTITYTLAPADWAGYAILEDGQTVDTGDFLGFVDVAHKPWIYVFRLEKYLFITESQVTGEGAWAFAPQ
jgi:hypothetical protein